MKSILIFSVILLSGWQSCLAQTISKADIAKTLVHIQTLAREQGEQLKKAQGNLDALQRVNATLTQRNAVLEEKASKALRKFISLYILIALLVGWILRRPIIAVMNAYVFHV
jgi:hypothetical protein